MAKHCTVCGNEVSTDAHFCGYCGVALESGDALKSKNERLSLSNRKSQSRFLTILSLVLILAVLGFYLLRNAAPTPTSTIEGEWVGRVYKDDGLVYDYLLQITLNGSEIRGTAITSALDEAGSADAQIIGSYANQRLSFQEYGGGESGDWENEDMCFWEFDLELVHVDGEERLTGTFEAIDCNSSGTVELSRAE
jgi:predicted nucleic acid-binding Zn ribbon protein